MLDLEPSGGAADLGCGVGTLAIVAAKLGWAPVVAVDRVAVAIEVAHENVARNGVDVACAVADLAVDDVPAARCCCWSTRRRPSTRGWWRRSRPRSGT